MIGGSLFYDFARVAATPAPFQSFVLSAGVVTDYVYGAGMHWQGGRGGFPCDGSGSLNEWNVYIWELENKNPPRPSRPMVSAFNGSVSGLLIALSLALIIAGAPAVPAAGEQEASAAIPWLREAARRHGTARRSAPPGQRAGRLTNDRCGRKAGRPCGVRAWQRSTRRARRRLRETRNRGCKSRARRE